jgi:short-subunit dehydrogenase|tara:strand:+ start:2075 stop:2884 length:810 start_codon:yes stop_codon:yes gene_type:complete
MIRNEIIWITGASSGIGKAIAKQLAQQGNKVIASGRNRQALDELASHSDNIFPLICDLVTDSKDSIQQSLIELTPKLDRIILSAGDCQYLDIKQDDWSCIDHVMAVNFHGSVRAIQASLPLLEKTDNAHIVGISSMASMAPFTQAEAYGASKAALSYFLKALRIDLKDKNIDVTDVMPGFIDTPLTQQNDFSMPFLLSSKEASHRIIKAIEQRSFTAVFPQRLYWLFKVISLIPKTWVKINSPKAASPTSSSSSTSSTSKSTSHKKSAD